MELKDTISKMNNLSSPSSLDDMPIIAMIEKPFHDMSEEERTAFINELRVARINSTVLVNRIEKELTQPRTPKPSSKTTLDISDLL